ncbi:1,6-anhydro-N-acetylmuramyl-L-alanine amidase AmpD [Chitinimonas sp. BJB300]|uniref:1,6-anhydro-N-acetylmuramyl-L-alanine amidase AmpD n=1 Tax=Chitinimonas sp. BJB300 TaxID=1559339 RepID=UPI000C0CEACF|nr:1,6-anhydro-N-acetylmuramyl-L-alanine amidase AmpD [Chitinimonas sp. BJB300]PHV12214.1 1,6-anhydro-N-acetylmuramyl-L-alanine amidase AmpD [Chitinimonas sp. BJB300]TSJ91695.1 1,6-anhydro-N-acetylmuramyl-L-alanine amidase AmpD [Chitinimonas sp. BJB300]
MVLSADGWLASVRRVDSPNCDDRPGGRKPDMVVIHSISLPPGEFGGDGVERLFTNRCDPSTHTSFAELQHARVSAHFFVRRTGEIIQFVSCNARAWHAGVSRWQGREGCNDFSIGIELEGGDAWPYEAEQYAMLDRLLKVIRAHYPIQHLVGHCHIAPDRKTDPGPLFDWSRYPDALV